jgi:hypothetical protein
MKLGCMDKRPIPEAPWLRAVACDYELMAPLAERGPVAELQWRRGLRGEYRWGHASPDQASSSRFAVSLTRALS